MEDISKSGQEVSPHISPTLQPPGTGVGLNLTDIDVLKDRLEQQKANKLKAEQLVSTLSRIKAREKASRKSSKLIEKKADDGAQSPLVKRSGSAVTNTLKEKSILLKKKLEEDRAKLEIKRGQEDLGRVSQIVEHIRVQLEDQDKTIQQIHSNISASNKPSQPVKEILPPEPDISPEVKQRIADLEMKILDLQENLREKDSVISARTQAITLLSEDMARKGKNTVDTLEETRSQMKTMQANFVALEDRMNEERVRLREELDAKKLRVQQLEKNFRSAESARFDLSTRVAELQEKIVALQNKNISLEEELNLSTSKAKELQEVLDTNNKQIIKMKAQFKAKLKSLEEERDALRKEERTNEELNQLRERITELEDEKGNLQLHLVDFDEIQETGVLLKERVREMEEKLQRQENDLSSHIKALTALEAEKLDLIEAFNIKNTLLNEKDQNLEDLKVRLSQIEETKISAEMKCLELEEKLDLFNQTHNNSENLNSKLEKTGFELLKYQETVFELNSKLESQQSFITSRRNQILQQNNGNESKSLQDLSSDLEEWEKHCTSLTEKINDTLSYCKELEEKKIEMESENEKLVQDCIKLNETVSNLNVIISNGISNQEEGFKGALAQKDIELFNLAEHNKTLETELDHLRFALQSTTAELHTLSQQMEDANFVKQKFEELSLTLSNKDKELEETAATLEERTRKLSEYKKFHKLKSEDVLRISHELDAITTSSSQRISELEGALSQAQKVQDDLKKEIGVLKETTNLAPESVDTKLQEQSLKMKKLLANVKIKTKLVKDLETKIIELENIIKEKDMLISSLESDKSNLPRQEKITGQESTLNISMLEEKCKSQENELEHLKQELSSKSEELECLKNSSSGDYATLVQIKELENQNKKLNDISETKSDKLKKMENEITDLNITNKSLISELEQMQESYNKDSFKNASFLEDFEKEMLGNKQEILELSNQLMDVTSKYDQAWAKLQEKEGYIEELEQQLERVKQRLLQIETTVEERRRSLEEKTEMLGARLWEAEKNNEQLEKHEGELEQKIVMMITTEEKLGNILQTLQKENSDLSKSLNESIDKNIEITQQLEKERNKIDKLSKQFLELQLNIQSYETISEDNENVKKQLIDAQEAHSIQVKWLENRLAESEQTTDMEVQRLLEKISSVEVERQELHQKLNSTLFEKQALEEEMGSLQQTIVDLTREEVEQLRINQENLAKQLNVELEKRQAYINRIQELETQISTQSFEAQPPHLDQSIIELKCKLENEIKEKEELKIELLREKAREHVDDVVAKAQETYFQMTCFSNKEIDNSNSARAFFETASAINQESSLLENENIQNSAKIGELEHKIANLELENTNLKSCLEELKSPNRNVSESAAFGDDWQSKDEEDGWGWGSKDAMLEHEHLQKQKINFELEGKVNELESKMIVLQEENTRLMEDLKLSQTKCGKLIKKVKEIKSKSDSLERSSRERSLGADDLDIAMQEELKSQIEKLERSLKEYATNLNSLQAEKEKFLKRIEVLTSANERLVEMKERQDIEVEMWQRRSNDLQNKIQGLEWTITEFNAEHAGCKLAEEPSTQEKNDISVHSLEMEEQLNALAAENEYLQSVIVEFKDKNKNIATAVESNVDFETYQAISNQVAVLQNENDRLISLVQALKLKIQESTIKDVRDYSQELEHILEEHKLMITNLDQSYTKTKSPEFCEEIASKCVNLELENSTLQSVVLDLKMKLQEFQIDNKKTQEVSDQPTKPSKDNDLGDCFDVFVKSEDTPTLFRGFTSSSEDPFGFSLNNVHSTSNIEATIEQSTEKDLRSVSVEEAQAEGSKLNVLLLDREKELNYFKNCLSNLEKENHDLKQQMEVKCKEEVFRNSETWDLASDPIGQSELQIGPSSSDALETLNKILLEKDVVIDELRGKLNSLFSDQDEAAKSRSNIQSEPNLIQSDTCVKSEVNNLNEQIYQLTKTLHEKNSEIETLNDKKEKYKEMYFALSKDNDIESINPTDLEQGQLSDQNVLLNQLLDDKETQLEIMSQQIDRSIVAKENLQDELCLKLCEIEAAKGSLSSPKLPKELSETAQPENIEEVKTLCENIEELTKLLQEKEMELDLLKQQLEEVIIEKDNIIYELKNEVQNLQEKLLKESSSRKEEEFGLEHFKETVVKNLEKQYNDELQLKEQQLMNTINDLRNTHNYCQNIQSKLQDLEINFEASNEQKKLLITELHDVKMVLQDAGFNTSTSLVDEITKLISKLSDIDNKLLQAKQEMEEQNKTIVSFKEGQKSFETDNSFEEKCISEQPVIMASQVKKFASEPFRISTEQSSSDDDSSSRHFETVQGQMMLMNEIQSLKQVLAMKDAEITRLSIAMNNIQESLIRAAGSEEESLRQRLDEALYTLHLRDVRCDELSLELMQLLEERDSLQLKLSNAIRFNEELREHSKLLDKSSSMEHSCLSSSLPDVENSPQLKQKLDQLHHVGYRRDPGMQQEQQRRHAEQMQLYTHTQPQDEAQQSSGFFSWLFGASLPNAQDS